MFKQESQHITWREPWRDDCLRRVWGFANAPGSRLLLGVNDKGQVVGLPDAAKLMEELTNKARDLLGIGVDVNLHSESDLFCIEVVVPAYPKPISVPYDHGSMAILADQRERPDWAHALITGWMPRV